MALDSPYTLNSVRTMTNYGLEVRGNTVDPIFTKGFLNTKPNVMITGSTCVIDYSNAFDVSDRLYLNKTFGSLTAGNTFTFNSAEYYDEANELLTNLYGTCIFSSSLNNNAIIISTISSGLTASTTYNYYSKDNFTEVPQYTFNQTGATIGCFLINNLPNLSQTTFKSMGVIGSAFGFEEYIEIIGGSTTNSDRIPIYGTATLIDSQEILYFASGGTSQNLFNTATQLNLYLRGMPTLMVAPYNSNITGIFTVSGITNGNLISCYENQSLNEAILRKAKLSSEYFGSYINCKSCLDYVYGENIGTPYYIALPAFDNLMYLQIDDSTTPTVSTITALYGQFTTVSTLAINTAASINTTLKIDLSHPTLAGYELEFFSDAARTMPLGSFFEVYGDLGYNGAFGMVINYQTPSTLYGVLSGPNTLYFTVNV
jgi:hypothetical protein